MKLELNGLAVECIIGELPHERERPQRLMVDVSLDIPDDASESDALEDTVDYAELAESIRRTLADARCRMIERAARRVAEVCLRDLRVRSVEARVVKSGAVPGLASAAAVFSAKR